MGFIEGFIKDTDNILDHIVKMSDRNPGALRVLIELFHKGAMGELAIYRLDGMEIRGWRIWLIFKYYCNDDLDKLIECAINKDKRMMESLNEWDEKNEC